MAATFEKLLRKIAPEYADTVLAIENQPFHYRGKMIE
jgi:predicted RNA methylase